MQMSSLHDLTSEMSEALRVLRFEAEVCKDNLVCFKEEKDKKLKKVKDKSKIKVDKSENCDII